MEIKDNNFVHSSKLPEEVIVFDRVAQEKKYLTKNGHLDHT
jgi:hypothetical protein